MSILQPCLCYSPEVLSHNKNMIRAARFFTIASLFAFLIPPRGEVFGFFLRHEFLFQIVVGTAFMLLLVRFVFGRAVFPGFKAFFSNFTVIDGAALAFVAVAFVATVFSTNVHRSLFGMLDRMTGFISILHIGMLYFLVRVLFSRQEMEKLVRWASISIALVAVYALLQNYGLIDREFGLSGRSVGSFTNPAIIAGYLLFGVFLSLFGHFLHYPDHKNANEGGVLRRNVLAGAAVLSFWGLVVTQTRGAFIGVVAGLIVLAVFLALDARMNKKTRRFAKIFLLLAGIGLGLLFVQIWLSPFSIPGGNVVSRLTDPAGLFSGFHNRLISWQIAIKAFIDRPLFGWGPDNYSSALDQNFDTRLVENLVQAEAWFDKAHNIFFEFLSTTGAFGLLAFLFLLGAMAWGSWKTLHRNSAYGALLALIAAYAVNGIVIFDSIHSLAVLFFAAAVVAFSTKGEEMPKNKAPTHVGAKSLSPFVRGLFLVTAGVVAYSMVFFNLIPLKGLGFHYQGWQLLNREDKKAVDYYLKDFNLNHPYGMYTWQYLSVLLLKNPDKLSKDYFEYMARFAFESFLGVEKKYQPGARDYYMAGRLGNFLSGSSPEDKEKILRYLSSASSLAPDQPDIQFEIAQYYRNTGDIHRAVEYLEKSVTKYPKVPFGHMNLGLAYVAARDFKSAIASFEQAFELGYEDWRRNLYYVRLFIEVYTIDEFVDLYFSRLAEFYEALVAFPEEQTNAESFAQLAAIYKELGNYDKARQAVSRAIELDPTTKSQAESFLQTLPME